MPPTFNFPTTLGYIGAVTLLVIGVAVAFSEKPTDSDTVLGSKRLSSTIFILVSVLVAVVTYFGTQEGGILTTWFKPKSSDLIPGVSCMPE
jgi:hypothetical protein